MATRRRSTTTRSSSTKPASRTTRRRRTSGFAGRISPDVVRSILGTVMMALGAITLIALVLPGEGALTDWWRDSIAPWFETGRWLLPFLLLAGGWWIAAGPGKKAGSGWGMTLGGLALAYVGRPGRIRDPRDGPVRRARRWPHRSFPRVDARAAADRPRRHRPARGDRPAGADARVQPAAARVGRPVHRHGPLGRLDHGRIAAPRAGGTPGRDACRRRDQRHREGQERDGQGAGRDPGPIAR